MKLTTLIALGLSVMTTEAVLLQSEIEETAMTYEEMMAELEEEQALEEGEDMDEERFSLGAAKKKAARLRRLAKQRAARARALARKAKKAAQSGDIN